MNSASAVPATLLVGLVATAIAYVSASSAALGVALLLWAVAFGGAGVLFSALYWHYALVFAAVSGLLFYSLGELHTSKGRYAAFRQQYRFAGVVVVLVSLLPLGLTWNLSSYPHWAPGQMFSGLNPHTSFLPMLVMAAVSLAILHGAKAADRNAAYALGCGLALLLGLFEFWTADVPSRLFGTASSFRIFYGAFPIAGLSLCLLVGTAAWSARVARRDQMILLWLPVPAAAAILLLVVAASGFMDARRKTEQERQVRSRPSEKHRLFPAERSPGRISRLLVYRGELWGSTEKGLLRMPAGGGPERLVAALEGREISKLNGMCVGPDGELWTGGDGGLLSTDGQRLRWRDSGLPSCDFITPSRLFVVDLCTGPGSKLWTLLPDGVGIIGERGFERFGRVFQQASYSKDSKGPWKGTANECLVVDGQGQPWLQWSDEVWTWRDGDWQAPTVRERPWTLLGRGMAVRPKGGVIFAADGRLFGSGNGFVDLGEAGVPARADGLIPLSSGGWAVCGENGVFVAAGGRARPLVPDWGLEWVTALAETPTGALYCGSSYGELWRIPAEEVSRVCKELASTPQGQAR